jgi:ferredoxin
MDDIEERVVSGLTIRIERTVCIASKNCIHLAPEVFELGMDQVVTFRDNAVDIERDRLVEACSMCPVDALLAFDEEGKQIVPR